MLDARMMADTVVLYLAPSYTDDIQGAPKLDIASLGTGTSCDAHVGISNAAVDMENQQEGELVVWEIMVFMSQVTPNMKAVVKINTMGGQTLNKYARVLAFEEVFPPNSMIEPYYVITCQESRETG